MAARRRPLRLIGALAALAATALAVWLYRGYRSEILPARERVATGSQVAQTPCGPIEYAAEGNGPAVLVVHGAGGGYDQGLAIGRPLAARGFRVIAPSRFGYLGTPMPANASAEAQADAHACLLDALGIRRTAILGASAGAPSTLQFALRHPDRMAAMILLVPATYVPREGGAPSVTQSRWTALLFDTALRSDFVFWCAIRYAGDTVDRAILATPPEVVARASAAERARFETIKRYILPVSRRRLGLLNDAAVTSTLARYELERIAAPALAISAEDDLFGTWDAARYTAGELRDARLRGYPAGGHLLVGHTDEVAAEIESFLNASGWSGR